MCLLKPFVLKNPFLRAHFKWIMHNMHKIMHILKYGGVSVGTDSRNTQQMFFLAEIRICNAAKNFVK